MSELPMMRCPLMSGGMARTAVVVWHADKTLNPQQQHPLPPPKGAAPHPRWLPAAVARRIVCAWHGT